MMKRMVLLVLLAAGEIASAATVKFAKTAVSVSGSAAYAELTVNKTGKEAVRVRFATVSGEAIPGREYCATNGVLSWAAGDTKAKKIRVKILPDEVAAYEPNRSFGVSLRAFEEDELLDGDSVADVTTPLATVTVKGNSKKYTGTITLDGYYDADETWCLFANGKKPALTVSKNGYGGMAALSLVRDGGTDGAVQVLVTAVPGKAKLGADFTLGDDPDATNKTWTVEWADGEGGERLVYVSAVDDEGLSGISDKACSLKLSSPKDAGHLSAKLSATTVSLTIHDDSVSETLAEFSARLKSEGVSVSGSGWYLTSDSTELMSPALTGRKKTTCTVSCTGPGFLATYGSSDCEGDFTWKCGKLEDWADTDVQLVLPSGTSKIVFSYTSPSDATNDFACLSSPSMTEEDRPFTWISFAGVTPRPCDKATLPLPTELTLGWDIPDMTEDRADEFVGNAALHYRVRLAEKKTDLDKNPLLVTNVTSASVGLPAGVLTAGKTYYWRVDYLYGDDGAFDQMVAKGKSVWSFAVTGAEASSVTVEAGTDAYGEPVTNGLVVLHQGVKSSWTLGAGTASSPKLSVVSGKLPDGLKLAKNSKTGIWTLAGTPTKAGTYRATVGGKSGSAALGTVDFVFRVEPIGLAAGTFSALLSDEGCLPEQPSCRLGQLTFTASAAGKLSAKLALGGKTWTFSDTGFAACARSEGFEDDEDVSDDEIYDSILTARLSNVQKIRGVSYTNELEIAVRDADADDLDALALPLGEATLRLCVPAADGKSAMTDADGAGIPYVGALRRDTAALAPVAAALRKFSGYYTVALMPVSPDSPDAPGGNGYLTVTVDEKGKAKVSGKLADGSSVSFSMTGGFEGSLGDWAGQRIHRLVLPLFSAKKNILFGGDLALEWDSESGAGAARIDSDGALIWNSDVATAMYDTAAGEWSGFAETLYPAGGWYDKVVNLQAHYLRTALSVSGPESVTPVGLEGNKLVVDKASGLTLSLSRATGVLTGSVQEYDEFAQKTVKASHAGVVLMDFQEDTAEGLWSVGYSLFSRKVGSKTVKVSRSFCIDAEAIDPDFAAGDEGDFGSIPAGVK